MTIDNNDVVIFGKLENQTPVKNSRFTVNVQFKSELSQIYFLPSDYWKSLPPSLAPNSLVYQVDWLSDKTHGMPTSGFPYTKSPYYKGPFLSILNQTVA